MRIYVDDKGIHFDFHKQYFYFASTQWPNKPAASTVSTGSIICPKIHTIEQFNKICNTIKKNIVRTAVKENPESGILAEYVSIISFNEI